MARYNSCLQMAKPCPHANVLGDCQAEKKTCDNAFMSFQNASYAPRTAILKDLRKVVALRLPMRGLFGKKVTQARHTLIGFRGSYEFFRSNQRGAERSA